MSGHFYPSTFVLINGIKVKEIFNIGPNLTRNVKYNTSGIIIEEFFEKNGEINGEFRIFYDDGNMKESKQFRMGKLHGEAKFFSRDGMMEKVEHFMNGIKMTGGYGALLQNGNTGNERFFSSNHHRTETTHHPNGSVKTISHFYKNKYHGKQVEFYDNDVMKSCRFYFHGKKSRFYKEYYPSGKLKMRVGYNKKGQKSGNAIKFYDNDVIEEEGYYEKDLRTGSRKSYYPSGKLRRLCSYKEGNLEGHYKKYTDDGKLELFLTYQNNMRHGAFYQIIHEEKGVIKIEGTYENDLKNGVQVISCNDEIQSIFRYNYGRMIGLQHSEMSVVDKTTFVQSGRDCSIKSPNVDICCVCYEETKFKTLCNHALCLNCISSVKMQCPMCRASF